MIKSKFGQLVTSRTTWTLVVLLLVNAIPAVKNVFPNVAWLDTVNTLLVVVAGYFKLYPSQNYNSPAVQAMPITPPPTPPSA